MTGGFDALPSMPPVISHPFLVPVHDQPDDIANHDVAITGNRLTEIRMRHQVVSPAKSPSYVEAEEVVEIRRVGEHLPARAEACSAAEFKPLIGTLRKVTGRHVIPHLLPLRLAQVVP